MLAGATGGGITLKNVIPEHLTPVLHKLEECGCKLNVGKNHVFLEAPKRLKGVDIETSPYPGFPTDMQSAFVAMLTISKGTSTVIENIFESRYKYAEELKKMGANILIDGKKAIIKGKRKLIGSTVVATDLRGGAAEVITGLVAKKKTEVNNIEHILRGYENLDGKLTLLGARIWKES